MNRLLPLATLAIIFALFMASPAWGRNPPRAEFVEGELLVKYRPGSTQARRSGSLNRHRARKLKTVGSNPNVLHVALPAGRRVEDMLDEFNNDPDVEYAQPNYIYHLTSTVPDDPKFPQQWGFKNTGQTIVADNGPDSPALPSVGLAGADMDMEAAWDINTDCSSVVVAVVDSGVNYNHEDLAANMWNGGVTYPNHGWDFVAGTNTPMDLLGHGTHVAGTIGAVGNNGVGGTGVCWTASIMAVRVMDATGAGTDSNIIDGIDFAVVNGAKIINMSLGGHSYDPLFSDAIDTARASGVLVVVAAGNDGLNVDTVDATYPCSFTQDNLICVAALNQSNDITSFSNYGSTSVDVGAPGENILSTWNGAVTKTTDNLTAGWTFSGTGAGWGYETIGTYNFLADPPNFGQSGAYYSNNSNDHAYKAFSTTGANVATVSFYVDVETEPTNDTFNVYASSAAVDPITAGTELTTLSGSFGGEALLQQFDVSPYISANTSVGFQLLSNASLTSFGVGLTLFEIDATTLNTSTYNVIAGTSMATPHVAGLSALVWAYNPSYLYTDVVNSIEGGGVPNGSLRSLATTGNAVNGLGSLSYIEAPTGVTASVQ